MGDPHLPFLASGCEELFSLLLVAEWSRIWGVRPQLASPSVGQRGWVAALSVERKPNQSHFSETKLLVMSDGSIHSDPDILVNVTVSEVE